MDKSKVGASRKKTGGRTKGTPNKLTGELKGMILAALDGAGGIDYLQRTAETHPAAFLSLVGKVLPMQVTGEGGGPIQTERTVRFVRAEPKPDAS